MSVTHVTLQELSGVLPDLMTLAKPLAGGLPIGAVLLTEVRFLLAAWLVVWYRGWDPTQLYGDYNNSLIQNPTFVTFG